MLLHAKKLLKIKKKEILQIFAQPGRSLVNNKKKTRKKSKPGTERNGSVVFLFETAFVVWHFAIMQQLILTSCNF
jgi:hypothetical protein